MPLPTNKTDRIKVYALIALGVGGALYGVWAYVYQPLAQQRTAMQERQAELIHKVQEARIQINRRDEIEHTLHEAARNLRARSEYDLIHPRLGNYLLQAREIVLQHGRAQGITNIQVTELDFANPPRRPDDAQPRQTRAYVVRVAAVCSYADLTAWLAALETENPLLAVSQMIITAQDDNPLQHQVRFELQWPVWIDVETRSVVRALVADLLAAEESL